MKHTPGPWKLQPLKGKYYGSVVQIGNGVVTVWGTERDDKSYTASQREIDKGWTPERGFDHVEVDGDYANARLIASAPELLAENEMLRDQVRQMMNVPEFARNHMKDQCIAELLVALKVLVNSVETTGNPEWRGSMMHKQCRAAIAKAEGE